jgi:hypothetical protein
LRAAGSQHGWFGDDGTAAIRTSYITCNLEERIPARLRRINPSVTRVLADLREKLKPFYSEAGRPSIDPELMLRMLIVGYCYGIRFERKLCEEVNPIREVCKHLNGGLRLPQSFQMPGRTRAFRWAHRVR